MRAQANWRHGRVTACIHRLNNLSFGADQPLQALQFRMLRSLPFGSPQVRSRLGRGW